MRAETLDGSLADALRLPEDGASLFWLGQAGFLLRVGHLVVLIDPYLSDSLAEKYRGRRFAHERMVPAPITPDALPRVDLVLCTHRHGDHMDPETLPVLARAHPRCRFVVPAAELDAARGLELPGDRLVGAVAGEVLDLLGLLIVPVPAAHERLEVDEAGRHRFVGYGISGAGVGVYHSGDCVPYAGLAARVAELGVAIALLPVNGRDAIRAAAGVPGNFTLDEAVSLCREVGVPTMVAHHWGMFDFNTCDPVAIDAMAAVSASPAVVRPSMRVRYRIG